MVRRITHAMVLAGFASGMVQAEIARTLGVVPKTVKRMRLADDEFEAAVQRAIILSASEEPTREAEITELIRPWSPDDAEHWARWYATAEPEPEPEPPALPPPPQIADDRAVSAVIADVLAPDGTELVAASIISPPVLPDAPTGLGHRPLGLAGWIAKLEEAALNPNDDPRFRAVAAQQVTLCYGHVARQQAALQPARTQTASAPSRDETTAPGEPAQAEQVRRERGIPGAVWDNVIENAIGPAPVDDDNVVELDGARASEG